LEASTKNSQQLQSERDELAAERVALITHLKEAREESELTLLQLHKVQEELEYVFLQSKTNEESLVKATQELEASTKNSQRLQGERDGLAAERVALITHLKEAREESELTLLQLHQVQEELEHYFLISRDQANLLNRQSQLTQNAIRLASS
jgi:hypothetical protein